MAQRGRRGGHGTMPRSNRGILSSSDSGPSVIDVQPSPRPPNAVALRRGDLMVARARSGVDGLVNGRASARMKASKTGGTTHRRASEHEDDGRPPAGESSKTAPPRGETAPSRKPFSRSESERSWASIDSSHRRAPTVGTHGRARRGASRRGAGGILLLGDKEAARTISASAQYATAVRRRRARPRVAVQVNRMPSMGTSRTPHASLDLPIAAGVPRPRRSAPRVVSAESGTGSFKRRGARVAADERAAIQAAGGTILHRPRRDAVGAETRHRHRHFHLSCGKKEFIVRR